MDSVAIGQDQEEEDQEIDLFKSLCETSSIKRYTETVAIDLNDHLNEKNKEYQEYADIVHTDVEEMRITIPSTVDIKIKSSVIFKMLKDLIGKDLSKFALPVFINEPAGILMKGAEFGFYQQLLTEASYEHKCSLKRMVKVACNFVAVFNQVLGRINKPFNPMLGETYEFVSPKFRFISEMCSHHPPAFAMQMQGENFSMTRTCLAN